MHRIPKYLNRDVRAPLSPNGLKMYWNNFGPTFAESHESLTIHNAIIEFEKIMNNQKGNNNLNLIELACGSGYMAEYIIKNRLKEFDELRFADISEFMVSETQKKISQLNIEGNKKILSEVRNCEDLSDLSSKHYDIVLANLVIHLVTEPEKVFYHVNRILRDEGVFFLSYTDTFKECKFFSKFNEVLRKYDPQKSDNRQMFYFAQENVIERLVNKYGYKVIEESTKDVIFNNGKVNILAVYEDMLLFNKVNEKLEKSLYEQLKNELEEMVRHCNENRIDLNIKIVNKHLVKASK